jgi:uncharacterized protein
MVDEHLGGLAPEEWDRLAGGRFYSTTAWLRFCAAEYGGPGAGVVVRRAGEPVAAVPVRELTSLPVWSRYRWNDHLAAFGLPLLPDAGLLVGPPEGFQTHFLRPDGDGDGGDGDGGDGGGPAIEDLVDALRRTARSGDEQRGCVAVYLTTPDVIAARRAGVTAEPVLLDADAWIEVPDGGWPAWLETLPNKRRKNIRREERSFREAGYRLETMPLAASYERLGGPAAATLLKYGHETSPGNELVSLRRVVDCIGDLASVVVCWLDGEPLAFCIHYVWGDTVFLRWAGFDYDRMAGAAEYFNVLYYSQVMAAPERGTRWIHAGVSVPEAKALRGAELRPLWLLDLQEDSPLSGDGASAVRRHNAELYGRFTADPRTAGALVDREAWQAFT